MCPNVRSLTLAGHVSLAMLKRYSHIRMSVKKRAVDALVSPKAKIQEVPNSVPKQKKPPDRLEQIRNIPDALDVLQGLVGD
jgi:hypothetical protein